MIRKSFFWLAVMLLAGVAIYYAGLLMQSVAPQLEYTVSAVSPGATLFRIAAMLALLIFWKPVVRWRGRRQEWTEDQVDRLENKRGGMALLLLGLELFIGQNILALMFGAIGW